MMKRDDPPDGDRSVDVSAADFRALFEAVSYWGRWGDDDERGALNYLTPDRVAAAAGLIRSGETTTLSLPLNTTPAMDNPVPADHHMTMLDDVDIGSGTLALRQGLHRGRLPQRRPHPHRRAVPCRLRWLSLQRQAERLHHQ